MEPKNIDQRYQWELSVPLLNNRFIVLASMQVSFITALLIGLFLSFIFLITGELEAIVPNLIISFFIFIGLWLSMLLAMLIIFLNKMQVEFIMNDKKLICKITSKTAKIVNRLAIVLGILTGKIFSLSSGLIAKSQENTEIAWQQVAKVQYYPQQKAIVLRNSWRKIMVIYCLPENYEQIVEFLKQKTSALVQKDVKNPLFAILIRTFLTCLACTPLFILEYPFKSDVFIAILTLCFALATIWLVPFFAYVVMALVFYTIFMIFKQGFAMHKSTYSFMSDYTGFGIMNIDDWLFLGLTFLGLFYLIVIAWKSLKGKYIPGLIAG